MSFNRNNETLLNHSQQGALQNHQERLAQSFQNLEENDTNSPHLKLPTVNMNNNLEQKMIEQSPGERKNISAETRQFQFSKRYSKYRKGIKIEGETPQARVQSKLHFILSGFKEESEADSVSYYNDSSRRKSSSSSSSSVHSNKRAPLLSHKPIPDYESKANNNLPENKQEKEKTSKQATKYLFYSQATEDKQIQKEKSGKNDINGNKIEIDESNRPIARQRVVFEQNIDQNAALKVDPFVIRVEKVVEQEQREQKNKKVHEKGFENLELALGTVALNQKQQKNQEKSTKPNKPAIEAHQFQQIQDLLVQTPEKHTVVPREATKSVSINKDSSISGASKQQRYKNQPNKSSKSKASNSIELYDPMAIRPTKKQSLHSDRYSKQPNSKELSSKEFKTKSDRWQQSSLQSPPHTISKTKEGTNHNNQHHLNDALEDLVKDSNNPQDKSTINQEFIPSKKQRGNYLRTVELNQEINVQEHNQFLPNNIVSFKTESKRKIKTELSDRPEERKKVLSILKKRQEALAKKVRQQMRIGPTMFQRLGQHSGFSKSSSMNQSQKQGLSSPIKLKHHSIQNTGYLNYQKNRFFDHRPSERPYFPTENLKYPIGDGNSKPRAVHSEFSESQRNFPSNITHLMIQRPRNLQNGKNVRDNQKGSNKFSSEEGSSFKIPNKISYYNLNKIQREHKAMQLNNATSAKEKYQKLKKLIEQI